MKYAVVILVLSFLTGALRFTVPGHGLSWPGTYEAIAHIWCGVLIATAVLNVRLRAISLWALTVITVLETWMFFHH